MGGQVCCERVAIPPTFETLPLFTIYFLHTRLWSVLVLNALAVDSATRRRLHQREILTGMCVDRALLTWWMQPASDFCVVSWGRSGGEWQKTVNVALRKSLPKPQPAPTDQDP